MSGNERSFLSLAAALLTTVVAAEAELAWTSRGPYVRQVNSVTIDPADSDTLYAGHQAGVLRSRDGGRSWDDLGSLRRRVQRVAVDPHDRFTLFAAAGNRLFKSTDGGVAWRRIAEFGFPVTTLVIDPRNPSRLFTADASRLLRSDDGGTSWTEVLFSRGFVASLAIDPEDTANVYVSTHPPQRRWRSDLDLHAIPHWIRNPGRRSFTSRRRLRPGRPDPLPQ